MTFRKSERPTAYKANSKLQAKVSCSWSEVPACCYQWRYAVADAKSITDSMVDNDKSSDINKLFQGSGAKRTCEILRNQGLLKNEQIKVYLYSSVIDCGCSFAREAKNESGPSKSFACVLHPAANQSLVIHARGVSWPWPGPSPLDFWEPSDLSDWTEKKLEDGEGVYLGAEVAVKIPLSVDVEIHRYVRCTYRSLSQARTKA
uniref:Uncharacterized protein n=1 Tax=Oryza rufipogon TaxID=4529 RepID=A0A0E0NMM1_ORYRU